MSKCLFCYQEILEENFEPYEFHKSCSQKFFTKDIPPQLEYSQNQILDLGKQVIKSQKTVTGVQPKLSLEREKLKTSNFEKFTIVGFWGTYILKPQTEFYQSLPEIEDLTMHLAELSNIKTVKHTLIRLKSGELAYLTSRIDRNKGGKLHMEDMCQLTERMTDQKYKGSYEQIAKVIKKNSINPGLDLVNFYELLLFCYLTGNNDMHLKNFSLLKTEDKNYQLCPAYDLVASELVVEGDDEELALNLNGKKKKLRKSDFISAMKISGMNDKSIENVFKKFEKLQIIWHEFIETSFLDDHFKKAYHEMIERKFLMIQND